MGLITDKALIAWFQSEWMWVKFSNTDKLQKFCDACMGQFGSRSQDLFHSLAGSLVLIVLANKYVQIPVIVKSNVKMSMSKNFYVEVVRWHTIGERDMGHTLTLYIPYFCPWIVIIRRVLGILEERGHAPGGWGMGHQLATMTHRVPFCYQIVIDSKRCCRMKAGDTPLGDGGWDTFIATMTHRVPYCCQI